MKNKFNNHLLIVLFTVSFLFQTVNSFSQGAAINATGAAADASAILDISSSNQGILIPRMTEAQKQAIPLPIATGLMVYQTDGTTGFWYYNGSVWSQPIGVAGATGATGTTGPLGPTGADASSPSGVIVMWSGSIAAIPSGWALCDGTNGTPNLLDKFILSINSGFEAPGEIGGSASHSHTAGTYSTSNHTHTAGTYTASSHSHTLSGTLGTTSVNMNGPFMKMQVAYCGANNNDNVYPGTTGSSTATISGTSGSSGAAALTGSSSSESNVPPYFKLAFIMKL